jgi:uncharacterized ferritin-like protein (DUF455 family)
MVSKNLNLFSIAQILLEGVNLEDKLFSFSIPESVDDLDSFWVDQSSEKYILPTRPGRCEQLQIQNNANKLLKFPTQHELKIGHNESIARALHFFANHELLAIEMFAAALIIYPSQTHLEKTFKKGILHIIQDEQKHLKLYLNRMKDFGVKLGDYPLNGHFWEKMKSLITPQHFCSTMNLTFETANLDFANFYENIFLHNNDVKTANILKIVHDDEIKHVEFGNHFLQIYWKMENSHLNFQEYYTHYLPEKTTPARSKGMIFNENARKNAKLSQEFIDFQRNYKDSFRITERRPQKILKIKSNYK